MNRYENIWGKKKWNMGNMYGIYGKIDEGIPTTSEFSPFF